MSDDAVMKGTDFESPDNNEKIRDILKEHLKKVSVFDLCTDYVLDNWGKRLSKKTKQQWVDDFAKFLNDAANHGVKFETLKDIIKAAYESCLSEGLFEAFATLNVQFSRLAAITQGLTGQYFGAFDIKAFEKRINDTFEWYVKGHEEYVSPSFALVQSSGMGKTKLMKQFKDSMMQGESMQAEKQAVIMLLCSEVGSTLPYDVKDHFDGCLMVPQVDDDQVSQNKARENIINQLRGFVIESKSDRVVLLIDEAHLLTKEAKGGLYVSMRWWLRQRRDTQIVAVFAGTLLSLAIYQHVRPPLGWTRDASVSYHNYNAKGDDASNERKLYDPFFTITTMAMEHAIKKNDLVLFKNRNPPAKDALFDVRLCGSFGRPMFASLLRYDDKNVMALTLDPANVTPAKNGCAALIKNDILHNALTRILLSPGPAWDQEKKSLASVLATRVQMGLSTYEFAERATSHGYATLVGFRDSGNTSNQNNYGSVSIVFPPDPVCSALAMGLMRELWSLSTVTGEGYTITGKSPGFWVNAAEMMFDHGLFLPNRGDAGEVFAALYMLLLGDELRAKKDTCMRKFEIDLVEWLESLLSGGADAADSNKKFKASDETGAATPTRQSLRIAKLKDETVDDPMTSSSETLDGSATYKLNFIQVCRNYFRTHAWFKQGALEFMYATASGCYVFMNCPALDIVFAIKVFRDGNQVKYHPVLVSVKCWDAIGGGDMQKALDDMKDYLGDYRDGEDQTTTALCLLIVIGAQSTGALPKAKGSFPFEDAFVPIVVPADDKFCVNKAIVNRAASSAQAEILASHPYAHVEDPNYVALRYKARATDRTFGEALLTEKQALGGPSASAV